MRTIQITEDDKSNEQCYQDIIRKLRSTPISVSYEDSYLDKELLRKKTDLQLHRKSSHRTERSTDTIENTEYFEEMYETLIDENITNDETLGGLSDSVNIKSLDEWNALNMENELYAEENGYETKSDESKRTKNVTTTIEKRSKEFEATKDSSFVTNMDEDEYKEKVDHHDSDTDSFYNIWGDDDEWIYGNKLRNDVRMIHR